MFSYSVINARWFRAAYLSGRLFTLSASFSQYCENSYWKKWVFLCKVGFLYQKSQQISGEYSPERFEKTTNNDTFQGYVLKWNQMLKIMVQMFNMDMYLIQWLTENYTKPSMVKGINEITWLAKNLVRNGMEWIWLQKVKTPDIFSQNDSHPLDTALVVRARCSTFSSKNKLFFQQKNKCRDVISFCPRWDEDMEALNSSSECWASENCERSNSEQYLFPLFLELIKLLWKRNIYFYSRLDSDKQKVFQENSLLGRKTLMTPKGFCGPSSLCHANIILCQGWNLFSK